MIVGRNRKEGTGRKQEEGSKRKEARKRKYITPIVLQMSIGLVIV